MTLLISVFAAIFFTVKWYVRRDDSLLLGVPAVMFWGASLMWLGDAVWEYFELAEAYFAPSPADMLNDAFLGLSVVALGLIFWLVLLLIKDPQGVVKARLEKKSSQ